MRDWQGWETAWNQRDEGGEPGGGVQLPPERGLRPAFAAPLLGPEPPRRSAAWKDQSPLEAWRIRRAGREVPLELQFVS